MFSMYVENINDLMIDRLFNRTICVTGPHMNYPKDWLKEEIQTWIKEHIRCKMEIIGTSNSSRVNFFFEFENQEEMTLFKLRWC